MAGEVSDEEAAWRDLVAQYSTPAAADGAAPWPVREELSGARQPPADAPGREPTLNARRGRLVLGAARLGADLRPHPPELRGEGLQRGRATRAASRAAS